jgi:hypothetical protein
MSFELLGVGNGGRVVTRDVYMVTHVREHPNSMTNFHRQIDSSASSVAAIYSDSIVD